MTGETQINLLVDNRYRQNEIRLEKPPSGNFPALFHEYFRWHHPPALVPQVCQHKRASPVSA